ncbi:MAG: M48 family metallopeptidase [Candidatus Omnitrophota bacterium]
MDEWIKKAKSYSSAKRLLILCSIAVNAGFFFAIIRTGGSIRLEHVCGRACAGPYLPAILFAAVTGGLLMAASWPFTCLISYGIERQYGLSRQGFLSWTADYLKQNALSGALFMVMFGVFFFLLMNFPKLWWLYTGIFLFLINIVLARVFPMLVIPLFYKLTKISDPELKNKLATLARKAGIKILDIYIIAFGKKTSKANAAVCGIGSTKRILLSDTLLEKCPADEVEITLAHEMAHHKFKHFWKLSLTGLVLTLISLMLIDIMLNTLILSGVIPYKHSLQALPYIALLMISFNFMFMPVQNFVSRTYEAQADRGAIEFTGNPRALLKLMERLSAQNLSDPSPGPLEKIFFYNHPPAAERIAIAKNHEAI